jgi:Asp/Glu/hydantoin racemase
MHSLQFPVQALKAQREGFDAFVIGTLPDPMLREVRTIVDIPVVGGGEACFNLARMLGRRFGMLLFIDRMATRYEEQIREHGLAERCVGVVPVGFRFHDVLEAFSKPGMLIDRFTKAARELIAAGADVIIPGEIPLNVLLASEGVQRIDEVPLMDSLGVIAKLAESVVDLRRASGFSHSRRGWLHAAPNPQRVEEVLRFYGLGRFLDR